MMRNDIFSNEKRSTVMKAIKSKNTKTTELKMIQIFKDNHIIGWRRTYPLKGKPDFVFPKQRVVIFVDGCFWHGHDCRNITPKDNAEFWAKKRTYNKAHDLEVSNFLILKGWIVLRIWECELKKRNVNQTLKKIKNCLGI